VAAVQALMECCATLDHAVRELLDRETQKSPEVKDRKVPDFGTSGLRTSGLRAQGGDP